MKIYAATTGSAEDIACVIAADCPRVLISFAYDKAGKGAEAFGDRDWLFDSGAFSAWSVEKLVDLTAYIEWCLAYKERYPAAIFANLDVIPGAKGRAASRRERTSAIKRGMANANEMRAAGLSIIEAYHVGEPSKTLESILERRHAGDRLGLGGLVGASYTPTEKRAFCDTVFSHLRDRFGWDALPPVHGFGIAPEAPLGGRRYPWYSIDATTWLRPARYGYRVLRHGQMKKAAGHNPSRVEPSRRTYFVRILERYARLEGQFTELWSGRGVTFSE